MILLGLVAFGKSNPKTPNAHNQNVLVVGFDRNNLVSNYYGNDYLSQKNGVHEDSIHYYYFTSICQKLSSLTGVNYKGIDNLQDMGRFHLNIHVEDQQGNAVNIKESTTNFYTNLLKGYNSEYLLYLRQYQINWSGEPFNTNVHLLDYSLFDKNKNEILSGQIFLDSKDVSPIFSQKHAERQLKQLVSRIDRTIN
jgi:hypothetical protein